MKTRLHMISTLFAAGLLAIVGISIGVPYVGAAPVDSSDASSISNQVRHRLATLPWYGVFDNLGYRVQGTEVVLTGQVISEHDQTKYDAEKQVEGIPGVTKVVDNIEVLPPSPMDNQIRQAEYRAIFSKSDLGRYTMGAIPQVHIIVKGGHVALEGVVMNQMDKTVAGIAANTVPGVFSVTNDLQIG